MPTAADICETHLRKSLDELHVRAAPAPILDALIAALTREAGLRGENLRTALTLESIASELRAASRPLGRNSRGITGNYGPRSRTL